MRFSSKHLVRLLAVFAFLPMAVMAQSKWQEGVHYEVVGEKASSKPEIREVFSYWCPHCYTFEPVVTQLKQNMPDGAKFVKANVSFMPAASKEVQIEATRAMLAAKAMGDTERFNNALFTAIHKDRKAIKSLDDILAVYVAKGGNGEKLKKLMKSFGIKGQMKKNEKYTRGVSRVPTFIVNNKYQPILSGSMTPDSFVELVNWLATQK